MNIALLARQGWAVLSDEPSISVQLWKAKYLRHSNFWVSQQPRVAYWAWRGILKPIPHFQKGACKQMRINGATATMWKDPWVLGMPHFKPKPRSVILEEWQDR